MLTIKMGAVDLFFKR